MTSPSSKPTRRDILDRAAHLTSVERAATYGDATLEFTRLGRIWGAVLNIEDVAPETVALMLGCLKVARLAHDGAQLDSWVDLAGYVGLGGEISQCRIR